MREMLMLLKKVGINLFWTINSRADYALLSLDKQISQDEKFKLKIDVEE